MIALIMRFTIGLLSFLFLGAVTSVEFYAAQTQHTAKKKALKKKNKKKPNRMHEKRMHQTSEKDQDDPKIDQSKNASKDSGKGKSKDDTTLKDSKKPCTKSPCSDNDPLELPKKTTEVNKKVSTPEKKEGVVVPPKDADFINTATKGLEQDYNTWKTLIQSPRPSLGALKSFVCSHPQWPSIDELVKKVEEQLAFQQGETELLEWFEKHKPITIKGVILNAKVLLKQGKIDLSTTLVRTTFRNSKGVHEEIDTLRKEFGDQLKPEDYQARLNSLLNDEKVNDAKKILEWLNGQLKWFPKAQRDLAQLRLDLLENDPKKKDALEKRLSDIKTIFKNEPGLLYEELKWRRKNKDNEKVMSMLHSEAMIPLENLEPYLVWAERNIMIRRMIEEKRYPCAYELVSKHKLSEGEHYVNAQWLGAFLQIIFLNKYEEAYDTLKALLDKVRMPISVSKICYWLGIASEKLNAMPQAIEWYQKAAQHPGTYYGQLSINKLEDAKAKIPEVPMFEEYTPTPAAKQKFESLELVRVLQYLGGNSEPLDLMERFFDKLASQMDTLEDYRMLIDLSAKIAHPRIAVKISRQVPDAMVITNTTYPVLAQDFLDKTVNKVAIYNPLLVHVVHAVIRRESGFDANALSPAGARGLMQIMFATAKNAIEKLSFLCTDCSESCKDPKAFSKPLNNVAIGSAHLKELLEKYKGSIVLALCAYNAGVEAVDNMFCGVIGDPLKSKMDMVVWIELIPYYETRNYVMRVLENMTTYMTRGQISGDIFPKRRLIDILQDGRS